MNSSTEASSGIHPFQDVEARNWFANSLWSDHPPALRRPILLMGNGPFEMLELATFLKSHDVDCYACGLDSVGGDSGPEDWGFCTSVQPPWVVLGESGWWCGEFLTLLTDFTCLERPMAGVLSSNFGHWIERVETTRGPMIQRSRSLKHLEIVSQEIFLACLFAGHESPTKLPAPWPEFLKSCPQLQRVDLLRRELRSRESFPWPTTEAQPGSGNLSGNEWPELGLLRYQGYAVGEAGEVEQVRHRILGDTFRLQTLPDIVSPEYVASWGAPGSSQRLRKMAESIAAFCRNAKRRPGSLVSKAVEDWEADLAWLKRSHYDDRFDRQFPWPKT
jgi:hypothetical protein